MTTIVFCEDDPLIQKLIRVALRSSPYAVHLAENGAEGLKLMEREAPDIIFTDVSMPVLDGLQLCDAVRNKPALAHVPVILLTASVQRSQIEEALAHGVTDYLPKPFSPADLRTMIDKYL